MRRVADPSRVGGNLDSCRGRPVGGVCIPFLADAVRKLSWVCKERADAVQATSE